MSKEIIYEKFEEIADLVRDNIQPILYKYRDWSLPFNKATLDAHTLWFAHPKSLNDRYDVRVPFNFDYSEINKPEFFQWMLDNRPNYLQAMLPDDYKVYCRNTLRIIKEDPKSYFRKHYEQMRESELYDNLGILSLSSDPLNSTMWAYYANNSTGYCIGFDSYKLLEAAKVSFREVEYNDDSPLHSFVKNIDEVRADSLYYKHTSWSHEKEFRLLTHQITSDADRAIQIDPSIVVEVIVGDKMADKDVHFIITILRNMYKSAVELYMLKTNPFGYGLKKEVINY